MDIPKQLIILTEKYSLKEKALAFIDKKIDKSIESEKEIGLDLLEGYIKSDLIYEFGSYGFHIDKHKNCSISTKINIYSKKLHGTLQRGLSFYQKQ